MRFGDLKARIREEIESLLKEGPSEEALEDATIRVINECFNYYKGFAESVTRSFERLIKSVDLKNPLRLVGMRDLLEDVLRECLQIGGVKGISLSLKIGHSREIEVGDLESPASLSFEIPIFVGEELVGVMEVRGAWVPPFVATVLDLVAKGIGIFVGAMELANRRRKMVIQMSDALASALDKKSAWNAGHSRRVSVYSLWLALELGLSRKEIIETRIGGLLHDIGKFAIPDVILDKPDRLSPEEIEVIRSHTEAGYDILRRVSGFEKIADIALFHHERWDGKGYPKGLKGSDIPFLARIVAVADVFDALTSERPYRKPLTVDEALSFIRGNSGKMFDPEVVPPFERAVAKRRAFLEAREGAVGK